MIITNTICNCCGCEIDDSLQGGFDVSFGYGSKYDGQNWSFELCEDCMENIIKTFSYVPKGFMDNPYLEVSEKEKQIIFEDWKATGEWDELSVMSYERLVGLAGYLHKYVIDEAIVKYHPDKAQI